MTTILGSVKDAQMFALSIMRLDPKDTTFEEIPNLCVIAGCGNPLEDPNTSEEIKKMVKKQISAQKGFEVHNSRLGNNTVRLVIGPCRDGFDCWTIVNGGLARRL